MEVVEEEKGPAVSVRRSFLFFVGGLVVMANMPRLSSWTSLGGGGGGGGDDSESYTREARLKPSHNQANSSREARFLTR